MNERRLHPRADSTLSVELAGVPGIRHAHARDLSVGGVGMDLAEPLDRGSTVRLHVYLTQDGIEDPDTPELRLDAQVMWCRKAAGRGHAAGLRFLKLTPAQRRHIERFLARLGHPL